MKSKKNTILFSIMRYELKATCLDIIIRLGIIVLLFSLFVLIWVAVFEIIYEMNTFDLVYSLIFNKKEAQSYAYVILSAIYEEFPKEIVVLGSIFSLVSIAVLLLFLKRARYIKRKLTATLSFLKKK